MDETAVVRDLKASFEVVMRGLTGDYSRGITAEQEAALAWLETFAAVSLRIMRKTNPSKIREAARAEEIKARIHGRPVMED